jgi:hypothetical protein
MDLNRLEQNSDSLQKNLVKLLLATSMQPSVPASDNYLHYYNPNKTFELLKVT